MKRKRIKSTGSNSVNNRTLTVVDIKRFRLIMDDAIMYMETCTSPGKFIA